MKLIDNSMKSFQVQGKLPQWAIWVIAAALFGVVWMGVGFWARAAALRDLAQYVDHWNPDGTLQQETNYSCVPASIVMLLRDQGIETTTLEVATISGTDIRGTSPSGISKSGEHFGFGVTEQSLDFNGFAEMNLPTVIVFRYHGIRHAAYVTAWPEIGQIVVRDPVQGLMVFDRDSADEYFGGERWKCYLFERA